MAVYTKVLNTLLAYYDFCKYTVWLTNRTDTQKVNHSLALWQLLKSKL